ncbi:hypothetical protein CCB80_12245 [Armatimonadetes bacterium Uphvl-Ar1]|nr:hypothetical protein CCB80_12245 [Armatimonadetes bacterium Uphvl-Ar1]
MKRVAVPVLALGIFLIACSSQTPEPEPSTPKAEQSAESTQEPRVEPGLQTVTVSFKEDINPLIQANCLGCHSGPKAKEGIDMSSYELLTTSGEHGAIIKPGDSSSSLMIKAMTGDGVDIMPPAGKLPDDKIELVAQWIDAGAKND